MSLSLETNKRGENNRVLFACLVGDYFREWLRRCLHLLEEDRCDTDGWVQTSSLKYASTLE